MNPKPLTFAQVESAAESKFKPLERKALRTKDGEMIKVYAYEASYWRGVAACARYFKTGINNLGV